MVDASTKAIFLNSFKSFDFFLRVLILKSPSLGWSFSITINYCSPSSFLWYEKRSQLETKFDVNCTKTVLTKSMNRSAEFFY